MKKILLLISLISILFLVGCALNNDDIEHANEQQEQISIVENRLDFDIAKDTYSDNNKIYEQYNNMDYFLSEDGKTLIYGDGMGHPNNIMNGFEGNVVSAIAIVRGDPSGYEFPLYVLSDDGNIFYAGIGENTFSKIIIEENGKNVVFTDITANIESNKSVVKKLEDGTLTVVQCEYYEIYGKNANGEIILIDSSSDLWS